MICFITGAAGTLGSALAHRLAQSGNKLVLLDRNLKSLEKLADEIEQAGGHDPMLVPLDFAGAGPDDYREISDRLGTACERLDLLIHTAADFHSLQPLEQTEPLEWFKIMQAGLTGPFLLTQALFPLLRGTQDSRVAFIVDSPQTRARAFWGAYGVTQPARQALADIWQEEAGERAPQILSLDPGPFQSTLRSAAWPSEDADELPTPETAAEQLIACITRESSHV